MATTTQQRKNTRKTKRPTSTNRPFSTTARLSTPRWDTVSREDNERLLKLWQTGAVLRESQKLYVWQWFDDYCTVRLASQFRTTIQEQRQRQRRKPEVYNQQTDRILLAMEFFRAHKDRQIGWCMRAYRLRFARLETIRFLRSLGIDESTVLEVDSARNRRYTILLQIIRQEYTMRGDVNVQRVLEKYKTVHTNAIERTMKEVCIQATRLASALSIYYPVVEWFFRYTQLTTSQQHEVSCLQQK